jgi:hypothetical protein
MECLCVVLMENVSLTIFNGKSRNWVMHPKVHSSRFLLPVFTVLLFISGCGTLENGRGWGQDAFYPIDFDRITRAGRNALFNPRTLVPLAGAAVFAVDDFDQRVSDWAVDHKPIFGSSNNAREIRNKIKDILEIEVLVTGLATPSGDDSKLWLYSKLKGLGVELAAVRATRSVTNLLKDATNRRRPNGANKESFPSGCTSFAFSHMTLANRNLDSIGYLENITPALKAGNTFLAMGVGWARVEEQGHYPSDVLVGAALGNFLASFIHDAFLNLPEDGSVDLAAFGIKGGAGVQMFFRF